MDFGLSAEDSITLWISIKLLHAEELLFGPTRAKMGPHNSGPSPCMVHFLLHCLQCPVMPSLAPILLSVDPVFLS